MADDDKLAASIARGHQAAVLIAHPLMKEAFEGFERDCITAWKATNARDTEARDRLWQAVQVAQKVHDGLRKVASDGRIAQAELTALIAGKPAQS